ncbi:MAG: type II toxin-antitoxin system VapC family toxin [bacterium]
MPKLKPKIYLDTSVPSNFYDADTPEQTALTRLFWEDYLSKFQAFISEATVQEIKKTSDLEKRRKTIQLLNKFKILKITSEIENLAGNYLKSQIVPKSHPIDALHLACATFYEIDFLVTWNITHMANPNKRKKLTEFNKSADLFIPQLTTPEELIKTYAQE